MDDTPHFKKLSQEQKKKFISFLAVTFTMSDEELQAIDGVIPMTQELFDSITDKCIGPEFESFFDDFILKYPDFLIENAKKLEMDLDVSADDLPDFTPAEQEKLRQKIWNRIRENHEQDDLIE